MTTLLNFMSNAQGIGIGKVSTELNCIDSALPITLKSTNLTNDTTVTTDISGTTLEFTDIENTKIGFIQPYFYTDGAQGIKLFTQRKKEDGTNAYNGIILNINSDNKPSIAFMGNQTKEAWHTVLKPDVLFTGDSRESSITLSASAANYRHMKIFYESKTGDVTPLYGSVCVYQPNGKYVNLFIGEPGASGSDRVPWWKGWDIWIDGNTIKDRPTGRYYNTRASTKTQRTIAQQKNMYITRVEAW